MKRQEAMQEMQRRAAVAAQVGVMRLADRATARVEQDPTSTFRFAWVVLIGVFVVAGAAAAFVWCKVTGHNGFAGQIEAVKGPFGVKIGVRLGCF
jgi:hypothetical protein